MNTSTLLWVIALSGAGTFLIRYLPMAWQEKGKGKGWGQGRMRRALDAIGPSAIVALLVVSFSELVSPQALTQTGLPVIAGLLGVLLGSRLLGSIAWATLAGVAAYGLALWLLA